MKKVILAIVVAAFALISCNKESFDLQPVNNQSSANLAPQNTKDWGIHRHWSDIAQKCIEPAAECFDDIIVTPKINLAVKTISIIPKQDEKELETAIVQNNMIVFFKENYKELSQYFRSSDLDRYLAGELSLSAIDNKKTGKTFVFFKLKKDEKQIVAVYPFIIDKK